MMASILGKRVNGEGKSLVFFRSLPSILIVLVLGVFLSSCRSGKVSARGTESGGGKTQLKPEEIENHAGTGFPLTGRHRELTCEACHGDWAKKPSASCQSCHRSPHESRLKRKCEDCHKAGDPFRTVSFHHPDKGLFSIHPGVGCDGCHPGGKFLEANRNCTSCHADFHKGALGQDCYRCHRQPSWQETRFHHNETGFPLMGAHQGLECGDCHRDLQTMRIVPRPVGCVSCHAAQYRNSRFPHGAYGAGTDCQECHVQDKWAYAHSPFWFNIQTGTHAGVSCGSCHKTSGRYREYSCHECHKGHSGDHDGRCLDCHAGGFPNGKRD